MSSLMLLQSQQESKRVGSDELRGDKAARQSPLVLEKQLGLWDVYALSTGATLSAGVFLLPGLAAAGAGAAMPLSYLLGAAILLPGLLSHVELATAMPKAGGIYYFLDRSLGPLAGTIGGFGTWIALILKSSFALIGVGAYLQLFVPGLQMGPVAAGLAVFFGVVNYFGTKKSGSFQGLLLLGLLILLAWFLGLGVLRTELSHFSGFFASGSGGIISTAGLVIVSYMGLTKVVGVAEEVKNPGRNLPLGMFLALGTVVGIFILGTSVMVGVVGVDTLAQGGGDLTPAATVAERLAGPWGAIIMTVAALFAFSMAANAGVMSAARYPLAMARDRILPDLFSKIGARGTPTIGIAVTVGLIVLSVTLFDPTKIAKLASAFKLVVFALSCIAVIVMRESRIESYDPAYRSPFYPGFHILGVLGPAWLIVKMGPLPTLFTGGLILFGATWYSYYARDRSNRAGAIYHVFERLGRQRSNGLDPEFRSSLDQRSPSLGGPFEELCRAARVLDLRGPLDFEEVATQASQLLAIDLPVPSSRLLGEFLEGMRIGATPVSHGAALPHLLLDVVNRPFLVLARVRDGVEFDGRHKQGRPAMEEPVRALFFLVGPKADPAQHLDTLANIASRVDQESFMQEWLDAEGGAELKRTLVRDEDGILVITLRASDDSRALIGLRVSELSLPDDTLIATIHREGKVIIPQGDTALFAGDRLSVIGRPEALSSLRDHAGHGYRS